VTTMQRTIDTTMKTDLHSQPADAPPHSLNYAAPNAEGVTLADPKRPPPATWLRVLVSVILIIALLIVAGGIFNFLVSTKPTASKTSAVSLPPLVDVLQVDPRTVREEYLGYGTARAKQEATVAAEVMGRIVDVPDGIDDGKHVEAGTVLAEVDKRDYQNALEQAEAQLADIDARLETLDVEKANAEELIEIAQRELTVNEAEAQRLQSLRERGNASKKELDFARLAAEQSRRQLQTLQNSLSLIPVRKAELIAAQRTRQVDVERARINLDKATIRAPLSGQLDQVFVDRGDMTMQGAQVARIIDTNVIEIPVELPLATRHKVNIGAGVTIEMDSAPGEEWKAQVVRLAPIADQSSRTFLAYVEVDNREQETPLVPGSFVTARVQGKRIDDALIVPRGVIVGEDVFVANDEHVVRKRVVIDSLIGDKAVVSGAIVPGDRVIVTNLDSLFEGEKVRIAGEESEATTQATEDVAKPAITTEAGAP